VAALDKYWNKLPRLRWLGAAIASLICAIAVAQAADFWTPTRKNAVAEMLPRHVPGFLPDNAVIDAVALLERSIRVTVKKMAGQTVVFTLLPRSTPRVLGQSVRFDVSAPPADVGGVLRAALIELVRQREGNFSWEAEPATAKDTERTQMEEKPLAPVAQPAPTPATQPDPERQAWVLLPIAAIAIAVWRVTRRAQT